MTSNFLVVGLLALASAQPAPAQDEKPLSEACPNLTAREIDGIENFKGEFAETAIYARSYCVSVEEAHRRFEIQLRGSTGPRSEPGPPPAPGAPDQSIGSLNVVLMEQEPDTFAGLWIQHEPTYGVAVAFTRDAAATLAKYTGDPLFFAVERAGPSLIELRLAQDRIVNDLTRLGINWYGAGGNVTTGKVEISLGQSADPIREAAARGEIGLPDYVIFNEPNPFPIAVPPIPAGDTRVRNFPQFANRTDGGASTLVGVPDVPAKLALRNGCLWLEPEGEEPRIAIWEQSEALDLTDPDRVAVMNRFSGAKVYANSDVVLMGLQPNKETPPTNAIGTDGCPGPYRVVRGIVPRESWDAQRKEAALAGRERELGSRVTAEADYAADMARFAELKAWRDAMMMERGDVIAQIYIDEGQATAHVFHTAAVTLDSLVPAVLRGFVTGQVVPAGANALDVARDDIAAQLALAGIAANIRISEIEGFVGVNPGDITALSQAGVDRRVTFPALVRLELPNQSAIYRQDIAVRSDPEAIWYPLEAHPDFAAIRALVANTPIIRHEPPHTGETESRMIARKPSKAGSLQQTHFMIAYGQTVERIEDLRRAGFDPIEAMEAMNGRATVEKRAVLATDIVIAEPVGIDIFDNGPDGFASSVRWRVIDALTGNAAPGSELRQRLASGERENEAGERVYGQGGDEPVLLPGLPNSLEPGSRWVLHLNDALYRHMSYVQGGEGAARSEGRWFVSTPWMPPSRIDGDGIVRPVGVYPEPIGLEDLRQRLRPIAQAFRIKGSYAK
ncbi:hypothetical protein [Altererythrobacter aquiaggeris]|uniref:hypothetical protein n=1 Tax=Aestuarierythrobacter aquiaggeris TaxID=1898396 RepID=UPI003019E32B